MGQPEDDADSTPRVFSSWLASLALGLLVGVGSYLLAIAIVMRLAPRDAEGVRQVVVDWSWEYFAALPTILAAIPVLLIAAVLYFCDIGTRATRLLWLLMVIFALFVSSGFGIQLLHRDFIGKL